MIKISSDSDNSSNQIFHFINEKSWESEQKNYPKKTSNFFNGKKKEVFVISNDDFTTYLIGFGTISEDIDFQEIGNHFAQSQKKNLQSVSTEIVVENLNFNQISELVKGLFLGTYNYPFDSSHAFWQEEFSLNIKNLNEKEIEELISKTDSLCNGQFACMDWLNKPANYKKAPIISDFLRNLAKKYDLELEILNTEGCAERGLNAYLAVNQGSSEEAAFCILKYSGENAKKTIGLVGKCVIFDTGGISIKGNANLHYMKSDMGGATAVIGTLITAAERKLPVNIIAILPITDNAVSNTSYLPSDVITAYNGKTIEVIDTDAEGRMTLADGLSYLSKNFKTDILIDLATLTGSAVRILGSHAGALFGNNDDLIKKLEISGNLTNQKLWNLPMWDVWNEMLTSDVADLKNLPASPVGGCITAAKFLEHFIEGHETWAHLDIAGVAFGKVNYAKEYAATGYGVQLIIDFLEKYCKN
ncbi:leucyl aminopeptidase family protein [Halpernia frigidisoli]|uniref:Leucyl aminopeptidase n=1 Tax=Halpernia frigidisoli TaxID=1125876 RepID=A0A1I3EBM1_9FLAO|nr:leucyl aminopeptidase family protein [Halpernia frigidisoli]SFH96380.1 leucyl aminopeptidase [Halpernia frigidisoli]